MLELLRELLLELLLELMLELLLELLRELLLELLWKLLLELMLELLWKLRLRGKKLLLELLLEVKELGLLQNLHLFFCVLHRILLRGWLRHALRLLNCILRKRGRSFPIGCLCGTVPEATSDWQIAGWLAL